MIGFKENRAAFDEEEPLVGHDVRFERKLEKELHQKPSPFRAWLKVAASIIILIGIGGLYNYLGKDDNSINTANSTKEKNSESIQLIEAEHYYQKQFNEQFTAITKAYQDNESRLMIQQSQTLIANLEKEYKNLNTELVQTGDYRVATAMILNYKSRISILETLIKKLEYVSLQKNKQHEKINA